MKHKQKQTHSFANNQQNVLTVRGFTKCSEPMLLDPLYNHVSLYCFKLTKCLKALVIMTLFNALHSVPAFIEIMFKSFVCLKRSLNWSQSNKDVSLYNSSNKSLHTFDFGCVTSSNNNNEKFFTLSNLL